MNKSLKLLIVLIVIALLAIVGFLVYQYFDLKNKLEDPTYLTDLQTQQQVMTKERVITRLSAILLLPDETNPKIATISNIEELKKENAEFYKNAVNGDTLVLYSELAIIYRDSINKIINIAPIVAEK